jgi:hypothetical protein
MINPGEGTVNKLTYTVCSFAAVLALFVLADEHNRPIAAN